MNKTALVCGSLAIDIIMQYEGRFGDTLLADQLHKVNVSFLVPTMRTEFGGCSGNIASAPAPGGAAEVDLDLKIHFLNHAHRMFMINGTGRGSWRLRSALPVPLINDDGSRVGRFGPMPRIVTSGHG